MSFEQNVLMNKAFYRQKTWLPLKIYALKRSNYEMVIFQFNG